MMGEVAMIYRLMPESPEAIESIKNDLEGIVKSVGAELNRVDEKPIAFGLKALEIAVIMDDKSGKSGELEEKLSSIPGVQSMELVDMSLI
jgi:elongation factor 1-beta